VCSVLQELRNVNTQLCPATKLCSSVIALSMVVG
jgi:hypothetical protein